MMSYQMRRIAKCRKHKKIGSAKCQSCVDRFVCFATRNPNVRVIEGGKYLFEVPNNEEGQEFLRLLRKHLNKSHWELKPRARHSDRKSALGTKWSQYGDNDIKLDQAEWFAVYLYPNRKLYKRT